MMCCSWWYNWHVTPNHEMEPVEDHCSCSHSCGPPPSGKRFIPMVWGYIEDDRPWHDDINDPVADDYNVILGFNEPNHADQSDIPPEVAASAWLELQNLYPNKVSRHTGDQHTHVTAQTLVSPAPAGGNTNWFDPFFEACEALGCRIDYLATHDYDGNADHVMNRLKMLHQRLLAFQTFELEFFLFRYGKKIWLTEFAKCCTHDEEEVIDFMKVIDQRKNWSNENISFQFLGDHSEARGRQLRLQVLLVHHQIQRKS